LNKNEVGMKSNQTMKQQIIISGVGGQGVLFITDLLAQAAIDKGLPVLTSETHGMAQRGGTVVSHLKVGNFSSPLIRPGRADGLLALKTENVEQYQFFLQSGAWIVVNGSAEIGSQKNLSVFTVNGDVLSQQIRNPRAVNLIVLGFALAAEQKELFCSLEEIKNVLAKRLSKNKDMLDTSLQAVEAGFHEYVKINKGAAR